MLFNSLRATSMSGSYRLCAHCFFSCVVLIFLSFHDKRSFGIDHKIQKPKKKLKNKKKNSDDDK